MTLSTAVAPLAAYALVFQTVIYIALPARLRTKVAPLVTGVVGAGVALGAGALFGFDRIGLTGGEPFVAFRWGVMTTILVTIIGLVLLSHPDWRNELADPRLASLGRRAAFTQIFIRIPIFTALIEEVVFRGVLHAALAALYPMEVAIWVGAGLFGLWHVGPGLDQAQASDKSMRAGAMHTALTVVATTAAGVFLVWLRIETGSIWAPVAVHGSINMTLALFARLASGRVVAPTAGHPGGNLT